MTNSVYVPTEELAKLLAVKVDTIRKWVKFGKIPPHMYLRIGNTYRFLLADILEEFSKHHNMKETDASTSKPDVLSEPQPAVIDLNLDLTFNADDDL
jgi:excisionase family DNA binding protein